MQIKTGLKIKISNTEFGIVANIHPHNNKIWFVCSKGSAYPIFESEIIKLNTFNIIEAIKYLKDHRYQITQKENIYFLFDIDDSNAELEIYNEKELIALAEQQKEEFSK